MARGQKWRQAPFSPLGGDTTHDLHVFHILKPLSGTEWPYWVSLCPGCWKVRSKDTPFLRWGDNVSGNTSREWGW